MKKQKTKFVLAQATLDEVNKQLKVNLFVIVVVIVVLAMNATHFIREKSFFYAALIAVMVFLLFFMIKARKILNLRKQELTHTQ